MLKKIADSPYTYIGGPKGKPIVGSLPEMKKRPIGFLEDNSLNYGDIIHYYAGRNLTVQLNHPELIEYVLLKNHKNYRKGDNYIRFSEYLGLGLLTSYGNKWKRDRQLIQPLFNREYIEGLYSTITSEVISEIKKKWLIDAEKNHAVNITKDMATITINVALRTLFGNQITNQQLEVLDRSTNAIMDYIGIPRIIPKHDTNKYLKPVQYKAAQKGLNFIADFIREKMADNDRENNTDNIISRLQHAKYEDGTYIEEQDLIDQAVTMVFAGYETTATLLQWAWYALSKSKTAEDKLRSELNENIPDIENASYSDISKLEYLDMVFKESARLYPSFWANTRAPLEDDVIGGYRIKAGTTVVVPVYVIQRHPKWWDRPEEFIPERFSAENEKNIVTGSYIPFSLGPRKCIGYRFAEMEVKMVVAKLLPYFTTEMVPNQSHKMRPIISLKKEGDLLMYIKQLKPDHTNSVKKPFR